MADQDRARALELALSQIEKQHGRGAIMRLGGASALVPVEVIPSGSLALDIALGVGGIPRGRVTEIYTLSLHDALPISRARARSWSAICHRRLRTV